MELSDRVLEFAGRYDLLGCDAVIAGCSGGPDSMALLDILHEAGIRLYCVHINHNLRPGDCDRDEALVSDYCRDRDIPRPREGSSGIRLSRRPRTGSHPKKVLLTSGSPLHTIRMMWRRR